MSKRLKNCGYICLGTSGWILVKFFGLGSSKKKWLGVGKTCTLEITCMQYDEKHHIQTIWFKLLSRTLEKNFLYLGIGLHS